VAAGASRFIYVSGAGVGEGRPQEWYVAKGKAEDAVRSSGLEWVIVRPSWMYGPGDKALNKFAAIARFSPVVPLTSMGGNTVQPVHVDDVAEVWPGASTSPRRPSRSSAPPDRRP
jgi:NADH dehydrogenase